MNSANAARLAARTRELLEQWQIAREAWRDAKAIEFDERYIHPLEGAVRAAINAIEQVEMTLARIRRDCE